MEIIIPFQPRTYQLPLLKAFDEGFRRLMVLWHRKAGKDFFQWNLIIREAIKRPATYYYFFPTYTQGKKIIWDGITNDGKKFLSYCPEQAVKNQNGTELKLELYNGSIIQIIGTDKFDSIRGPNPYGCIFSEFAFQNPQAWEIIRPILRINNGWAMFNTTPNGKNHSYELHMMAKENPKWFTQVLTIRETGLLTEADMQEERLEGMSEEMIQQEYYCSYDVGALGAFYAKLLEEYKDKVKEVPYDPGFPVDVWLDLGRTDDTSMIFQQKVANEIRIIDHEAHHGEAVEYYVKLLRGKPYNYGKLGLPHDAFAKRMESQRTIAEQFQDAGFKVVRIPDHDINNGIQNVRRLLPLIYWDREKTKKLRRSVENYHRVWDQIKKVFRNEPLHDWSSHDADALRYMCMGLDLNFQVQSEPISMILGSGNQGKKTDFEELFEEKEEKMFTF